MYIDNMLSQQNTPRLNMGTFCWRHNTGTKKNHPHKRTGKNMNEKNSNKQTKIITEESRGTHNRQYKYLFVLLPLLLPFVSPLTAVYSVRMRVFSHPCVYSIYDIWYEWVREREKSFILSLDLFLFLQVGYIFIIH